MARSGVIAMPRSRVSAHHPLRLALMCALVSDVHMLPQELHWHGCPLPTLNLVAASVGMNVHASPLILFRPLRPRDTHSHTQVGVRLLAEIDEKLALSELPPS